MCCCSLSLMDYLCFRRYFRVCVSPCAYDGDRGLRGQVLLRRCLQPSFHHHLGIKPKHITPADRQVPRQQPLLIISSQSSRATEFCRRLKKIKEKPVSAFHQNNSFAKRRPSNPQRTTRRCWTVSLCGSELRQPS